MMAWDTTMFHFWVNVVQRKVSIVAQRAVFGVAGPVSSLPLGTAAWVAYQAAQQVHDGTAAAVGRGMRITAEAPCIEA
jgi:hypothetical protein